HNIEPEFGPFVRFEQGTAWLLQDPRFFLELGLKLTGAPPRVTDKGVERLRSISGGSARFIEGHTRFDLQPVALLPFKRSEHQLIFPDRPAEKNGYLAEAFRRGFCHNFGNVLIKRTVQDNAQSAFIRAMR